MQRWLISLILIGCASIAPDALAQQRSSSPGQIAPGATEVQRLIDEATAPERPDQYIRAGALEAQLLIDACWALRKDRFKEDRVDKLLEAHKEIISCLEKTVAARYPTLTDSDVITEEKISLILEELRLPFQSLYYFIMTRNAGCRPNCPPQNRITYLFPYARYLEDVIREMEYTRLTYKLPQPSGTK